MKKIGFVDYYISEWHANNYPEFIANILKDTDDDFEIAYAWAEEYVSPVDGRNTDEWCEAFGVEKCATIDELCEKSDYIFILSPDNPEKHLAYAKEVLKHGKNTYIDKTFAPDYDTAKAIFDEAAKYGTKFFSTSALRYADELESMDCSGGAIVIGGGPGIKTYGIHSIEMLVKLIDEEPVSLKCTNQGVQNIFNVNFKNGKKGTFIYTPSAPFVVGTCDTDGKGEFITISSDFFGNLMKEILQFFKTGEVPFDGNQTLYAIRLRDAALKAIENEGKEIEI